MYRLGYRAAALALAASTCTAGTGTEPDSAAAHADNVRIRDPQGAWAVRRALRAAARKLADPGCQRIFSDFRDEAGRLLQESLDDSAATGAEYLASLLFYDGSGHPFCRRKDAFAVAVPGSRVVRVCIANFGGVAVRDSRLAGAILIHEELHALGLGENPPTSTEITFRVTARCY